MRPSSPNESRAKWVLSDRAQRNDNLAVGRNRDRPALGQDRIDAFAIRVVRHAQACDVTARHDHQPLAHVVAV